MTLYQSKRLRIFSTTIQDLYSRNIKDLCRKIISDHSYEVDDVDIVIKRLLYNQHRLHVIVCENANKEIVGLLIFYIDQELWSTRTIAVELLRWTIPGSCVIIPLMKAFVKYAKALRCNRIVISVLDKFGQFIPLFQKRFKFNVKETRLIKEL